MERKNIKSECDFMGIKDNQLRYKCKKCNKKWLKPVNDLIKKFSSIYQFCNGDLNKFVFLLRKGVTFMKIWIAEKNLTKLHYFLKKHFKAN